MSIQKTLKERDTRYGVFAGHAQVTQDLKSVIRARSSDWARLSKDQQEAIDMILHKIGRIINGDPNYIDSWHDISGYATLVENRLQNEQNTEKEKEISEKVLKGLAQADKNKFANKVLAQKKMIEEKSDGT